MSREGHQCCFCGEGVLDTAEEPVEITIAFKDGSFQELWSHIDCYGSRLHKSVPWLSLKDRDEIHE